MTDATEVENVLFELREVASLLDNAADADVIDAAADCIEAQAADNARLRATPKEIT